MLSSPPVGIFKAVLWKELRENLKWAVAGFIAMSAGLAYKFSFFVQQLRGGNTSYEGYAGAFEVTILGAALIGLSLGLAQTVFENRGDKWGFLAHRPLSRSTLFWGKAVAGTALYVAAAVIPVALALLWMSGPARLPIPFDWRLALPNVADLLCGLVFYFAGFLTGMREARWYASRALGIGAPFVCFFMESDFARFWQAAAVCLAGVLVVGTAAWSTFVAGGQYRVQSRIGRAAVGISMGLGVAAIAVLAIGALMGFFLDLSFPSRSTQYAVTTDGAVVKTVTNNDEIIEVTDVAGRPLDQYRSVPSRSALSVDVLSAESTSFRMPFDNYRSSRKVFTRLTPSRPDYFRGTVSWYYVHRLNLIEGYENESGRLVGRMGPDGFAPGNALPRAFEGPLRNPEGYGQPQALLMFEKAAYRLDLDQREVAKVFVPASDEVLREVSVPGYDGATLATYGEMARFELIATSKRAVIQLRDGTKLLDVPHPVEAKEWSEITAYRPMRAPGMPTFLRYSGYRSFEPTPGRRVPFDQIFRFNGEGSITQNLYLPFVGFRANTGAREIVILSLTAPVGAHVLVEVVARIRGYYEALPGTLMAIRWTVVLFIAFASAAAALSVGAKYNFSRNQLLTWGAITFVLGPGGLLIMLAVLDWPALEACPVCGRKRVVTAEHCEHCQAPFAAPPMDGTEIYDLN